MKMPGSKAINGEEGLLKREGEDVYIMGTYALKI